MGHDMTIREIADQMNLSKQTIRRYLAKVPDQYKTHVRVDGVSMILVSQDGVEIIQDQYRLSHPGGPGRNTPVQDGATECNTQVVQGATDRNSGLVQGGPVAVCGGKVAQHPGPDQSIMDLYQERIRDLHQMVDLLQDQIATKDQQIQALLDQITRSQEPEKRTRRPWNPFRRSAD